MTLATGPNGAEGGSYQFDGHVNSYIDFPNNGGLDVQHSITVLCWLYSTTLTRGSIFSYGIFNDQQWRVNFWISHSGKLWAAYAHRNYSGTPPFKTDNSLARNQWYYVGTSYDHLTGIASIWVNGERVVQRSIGASLTLATQDGVRIGAYNERYFTGRIAAMQFFDAALTAKQINEVKESGLGKYLYHLVVIHCSYLQRITNLPFVETQMFHHYRLLSRSNNGNESKAWFSYPADLPAT